jgi:hypothetical protein
MSLFCDRVLDNPGYVATDFGVNAWTAFISATDAPGNYPDRNPATILQLEH